MRKQTTPAAALDIANILLLALFVLLFLFLAAWSTAAGRAFIMQALFNVA